MPTGLVVRVITQYSRQGCNKIRVILQYSRPGCKGYCPTGWIVMGLYSIAGLVRGIVQLVIIIIIKKGRQFKAEGE